MISVIIQFFLFLRRHSKIFKLLKPTHIYASIDTQLYQFDKKLTEHFPDNIFMFKVGIVTAKKVSVFRVILVRIFPASSCIQTQYGEILYLSLFSPNARKCGPE